jgi:HEAT repeat protein
MSTTVSRAAFAAALVAVSLTLAPDALSGDPGKDLKDHDVKVRLAAIEAIEATPAHDDAALLVEALKDKDWEVVDRAAVVLAKKGGPEEFAPLLDVALEGPTRKIRLLAARALAQIDLAKATEQLGKKTHGKNQLRAFEALGALASKAPSDAAAEYIDEGLKFAKSHDVVKLGYYDRDPVREAAAAALISVPVGQRVPRIGKLMLDPDLAVASAAVEVVYADPDPQFIQPLLSGLASSTINDVVERRIRNALRAIVAAQPPGAEAARVAKPIFDALAIAPTPEVAARLARLIGELGKAPPPPDPDAPKNPDGSDKIDPKPKLAFIDADAAVTALGPAVNHADPKPRCAAVVALGKIRSDAALAQVTSAATDVDARVRLFAVRTLATTLGATNANTFKVLVERLSDADPLVREEAAVAMGVKGLKGAIPALSKVVEEAIAEKKNAKWALGTVALVSMGKTQDPDAVEPLARFAKEAKDWRLVASAVIGLGRVQQPDAVDPMIDALDDKDPCVHRCAFEFLRRLSSKDVGEDSRSWRAWWKVNRPNYIFVDRVEEARKAKKYGYAPSIEGLYTGLDIVVMGSIGGGDHIEDLLKTLKIEHRVILSPRVHEAGLHPYALFVSNCWGKIGEQDAETLQWFVRTGGYLFASCWSLKETVEKVYPGVVQRFMTKSKGNDVIDYTPLAKPCVPNDPFLESVFDDWTRPQYVLEGAFLIEMLDPDRCQVLIDSPQAATTWGSGAMACWFNAGHGVILDSVNHFSHQGFHFATYLKTPEDRMAYAMDHMGTTYADLREFAAKKIFDATIKCEKEVTDESAFRFISNFVRFKRRIDL